MKLNEQAFAITKRMREQAEALRVGVLQVDGVTVLDCGVEAVGGIGAGLHLARLTMSGLAEISLVPSYASALPSPLVHVVTDDPVRACLGSQYAGRQIQVGSYFGMGSGPMRLILGGELALESLQLSESSAVAVGAIESRKLPTEEVIRFLRAKLPAGCTELGLAVAPASSLAGSVQVVARALETALHKLHELKFDVRCVQSGVGSAPMPPPHPDELQAIGRTNDAILYGGEVTLYLDTEDDLIEAVGPSVPSSSSADYGALFAELFARYGDFYKIDRHLFSPAVVTFINLRTGHAFRYGQRDEQMLLRSFMGYSS